MYSGKKRVYFLQRIIKQTRCSFFKYLLQLAILTISIIEDSSQLSKQLPPSPVSMLVSHLLSEILPNLYRLTHNLYQSQCTRKFIMIILKHIQISNDQRQYLLFLLQSTEQKAYILENFSIIMVDMKSIFRAWSATFHPLALLFTIIGQTSNAKIVKQIKSKYAFREAWNSAGDKLGVVDFSATWCGPCK